MTKPKRKYTGCSIRTKQRLKLKQKIRKMAEDIDLDKIVKEVKTRTNVATNYIIDDDDS